MPILREIIGDGEYQSRYGFSQDVLSLDDTLRNAANADCTRMLISAEPFAEPSAADDVFALLDAIGPRQVVVVQAVRSVPDWPLSVFAQHVTYGLSELSTWPVDRFAEWFADALLPGSGRAIERWMDGPWSVSLRTMFLPPAGGGDIAGVFGSVAGLPVALLTRAPANRRLGTCELHFLQALNIMTYDGQVPVADRTLQRECLVTALKADGIPTHNCSCPQVLDPEVRRFLKDRMDRMVPRWIAASDIVHGDPRLVTSGAPPGDLLHCRFPDDTSITVAALLLARTLDDLVAQIRAVTEARDFWHAQAAAWMDLAGSNL